MALFRRSLFGGRSLFGRSRTYDEPLVGRGGYYGWLTAPSLPLFVISLVLAVAVLLARYTEIHVPIVTASNALEILGLAYAILVAGVLLPRL